MTPDTRTPEQRREDERSLAHVARVAAYELAVAQTRRERAEHRASLPRSQSLAYRNGRAAGLAGWTHKGQPGMEVHEELCAEAYRQGMDAEWRAGYSEGDELRKMEQEQ